MIPDECFDPEAPVGLGKRYVHECTNGRDRALIITRVDNGWIYHCHRCKEHGLRLASGLAPRDMARWCKTVNLKPEVQVKEVMLPLDFTTTIPARGLAWLYKWGITDADINGYGFGYSAFYDRVILPIYQDGELVYWSGRYLNDPTPESPKYMNVRQNRTDIWFEVTNHNSADVVLVEDKLSTIRVGKTVDCYGLLYASVPDHIVFKLADRYERIAIWLDKDKRAKCVGYLHRYRSLGVDCRLIFSDKDPKFYTDDQIRRYVYAERKP